MSYKYTRKMEVSKNKNLDKPIDHMSRVIFLQKEMTTHTQLDKKSGMILS